MAKHLRGVYFGGNWATSNLKDNLADVTWQQATTPVYSFNTIVTLVYHMTYYVDIALNVVLEGGVLNTKDAWSFEHPAIHSQEDWEQLLNKVWLDAEHCAQLIEQLPESKMWEDFTQAKYGNYYRNIHGIIEHLHYHLGQIVIIKKIIQEQHEGAK